MMMKTTTTTATTASATPTPMTTLCLDDAGGRVSREEDGGMGSS